MEASRKEVNWFTCSRGPTTYNVYGQTSVQYSLWYIHNMMYIQYDIYLDNALIRLWTHQVHSIPRPCGRVMERRLWVFWRKMAVVLSGLTIPVAVPTHFRIISPWWHHQMETFSALLVICAGNSPIIGELPAQSQWRGALMISLICAWINGWVNNGEVGDLRRHRAHYDVTVMTFTGIKLEIVDQWSTSRVHSNRRHQNSLTFPWHLPDSIHISLTKRNNKSVDESSKEHISK